jgi:hypothetical protein
MSTLTEQAEQRAKVAAAVDEFLTIANDIDRRPAGYSFTAEPSGSKYRIVMSTGSGGGHDRSVHAFVDATTGDLLKAAGWKVPAKGVRYNLLTEMADVRFNFTWSGGYLYHGNRKPVPAHVRYCDHCDERVVWDAGAEAWVSADALDPTPCSATGGHYSDDDGVTQ